MPDDPPEGSKFTMGPRISLNEEATLILDEGRKIPVAIVDISNNGFRIKSNLPFGISPGPVTLNVQRSGDIRIEIRWASGYEAGGIFLDPPPPLD